MCLITSFMGEPQVATSVIHTGQTQTMSYIRIAWRLFLRQLSLLPKALSRIFFSCRQLFSSCPDGRIEIRLCDFGGSTYGGRIGPNLPDSGFFDPRKPLIPTPATDIFSLGSVLYTIMSGHWPHWADGEDFLAYRCRVDQLFEKGEFPAVSNLDGGSIIQGCWNDQHVTAAELLLNCRQVFNDGRGI